MPVFLIFLPPWIIWFFQNQALAPLVILIFLNNNELPFQEQTQNSHEYISTQDSRTGNYLLIFFHYFIWGQFCQKNTGQLEVVNFSASPHIDSQSWNR